MKKFAFLMFLFLVIVMGRIFYLNYHLKSYYNNLLDKKTINYVYSESAPRGRILDTNGKVLVDNIGIKTIFYTKLKGISVTDELEIASTLADLLDIPINDNALKKYYLIINNNGESLITNDEYQKYEMRKITSDELEQLKLSRITESMLDTLSEHDRRCATIYDLMNKGYSYTKKLIMKGVTEDAYSKIVDQNIKGITTELTWERVYNYQDTLKDIFGRVGSIPENLKEEYLEKGYALNDIVGLSYLELQYEDYLKGQKDLFKINNDNTLTLVKSGTPGSDLILSIDIDVQLELEKLLKENILRAKKLKNTDYFSESFSIVGNPKTGEIIALSGQKLVYENEIPVFQNVNTKLINTSYTVGSVVKIATVSSGYQNGIIDIGTTVKDGCVKLYQVPIKCSYKNLGTINDQTAIAKSSNYYQFLIAIGLTNQTYKYNMKLNTTIQDFEKLRSMYREYGLGMMTGVDLPNETIGIIGSGTSSDLLLNLSIGQYDTYTPIELFQYVNTIASGGVKKKPQLMKEITGYKKLVNEYEEISQVPLDIKYIERLQEAMHLGTISGTSRNYIDSSYNPAGKTGTSETFVDTNNDGVLDTLTTSIAFLGFAPYNDPKYSIVVMAPHIYVQKEYSYSKLYITRYISKGIMNFLFENR